MLSYSLTSQMIKLEIGGMSRYLTLGHYLLVKLEIDSLGTGNLGLQKVVTTIDCWYLVEETDLHDPEQYRALVESTCNSLGARNRI